MSGPSGRNKVTSKFAGEKFLDEAQPNHLALGIRQQNGKYRMVFKNINKLLNKIILRTHRSKTAGSGPP